MTRLLFLLSLGIFMPSVLHGCTPIEGDRILGSDLAAEHSAFAGIDPATDLGPAPAVGARRMLAYYEVERLARQQGTSLRAKDKREACFERKTLTLTEEILRAAGIDLPILDFSHSPLPLGKADFRREDLGSNGLWRGRWIYGENRSVPIWARVQVPGRLATSVSAAPEIVRGDKVRVEVSSGGVLLAFQAAADSSGRLGESVTLRNPSNGQRFRALVEAPGKVGIRK